VDSRVGASARWPLVLNVTCVRDRSARYYLADLAGELAAFAPRVWPTGTGGRWCGSAAPGLGCRGPVGSDHIAAVLSGTNPATGGRLVARPRGVCGYDLTVSAPKSVSVLFALGGPQVAEQVLTAHQASVSEVVQYLEAHALGVRRSGGGERSVIAATGLVGAAFTHGLSRAGDPHLHTHVLVANVAHGVDGRWSAVDGRGFFAHARAAGALYESDLRRRLADEIHVEWMHRGAGFRVAGLEPELLAGLSSRHAEIRAELAARSGSSSRARRVAWAVTRERKPTAVDAVELSELWHRRATASGHRPVDIATALDRRAVPDAGIDEHRFAAMLARGHGVARRHVVAAWSESIPNGAQATEVAGCVDQLVQPSNRVGVTEPVQALRGIVAGPTELELLGPRPPTCVGLDVWRRGARAVSLYRERWGTEAAHSLRGHDPLVLSRLPPAQLADHLSCGRVVQDTRRLLERSREPPHPARRALERGR
jgi:conjugative relaxase-like TrwC/TraI family protein